jgi:hypothetical protein
LKDLVADARQRWITEGIIQELKQELGLGYGKKKLALVRSSRQLACAGTESVAAPIRWTIDSILRWTKYGPGAHSMSFHRANMLETKETTGAES